MKSTSRYLLLSFLVFCLFLYLWISEKIADEYNKQHFSWTQLKFLEGYVESRFQMEKTNTEFKTEKV